MRAGRRDLNRTFVFEKEQSDYSIMFPDCSFIDASITRRQVRLADLPDQTIAKQFLHFCRREYRSQICTLLLPSVASFFFLSFFSPLNTAECTHLRGRVHACPCVHAFAYICVHSPACTGVSWAASCSKSGPRSARGGCIERACKVHSPIPLRNWPVKKGK